jgi:YVTN family beta-propeller protein
MSMAKFYGMTAKHVDIFARVRRRIAGNLGRTLALMLLIAVTCGSARAQYVGFAANSTDNAVSVFAAVTSSPTFGNESAPGNQDHLIATVPVGKTPVRIAVTPSPNLNRAYVTNQGDNSLWVIDVTNISKESVTPGSVTKQNVNASNALQLNQPGGIAILSVPSGANNGKVLAFVANQASNTVSIIDTASNTLFGIVTLGSAGTSTTLPEVAGTPNGTQVFVTNNSTANCVSASTTACPGVWMIDATAVTSGEATPIQLTGLNVNQISTSVAKPQGISAVQYVDTQSRLHTLVVVADSGPHSDGNGYIFALDTVSGATTITPIIIPNVVGPPALTPAPTNVAVGVEKGATSPGDVTPATVIDQAQSEIWEIQDISHGGMTINEFPLASLPTSLALANPVTHPLAAATFNELFVAYITESSSTTPVEVELYNSGIQSATGNPTSLIPGRGPTGLAFSGLDPSSPAVVWFIPPVSGGFPPPSAPLALGPNGASLAVSGESMVGNVSQPIQTILGFGNGNSCAIFSPSLGSSGTPTSEDCTANATNGGNGIGGTGTFPASGVYTVALGTTTSGGGATEIVSVGANCTVSSANVTPTINVAVGQTVTANISCTAPGNDQLAGNVQWGDGTVTVSSQPVPANGSTPVILTFTHQYTAPSTSAGYLVAVTVTDNSETRAASVMGGPISVTVLPVTALVNCTLSTSSGNVQTGQTVTAAFNCTAPPNDSLTATIDWGDKSTASTGTAAADANGSATFTFSHTYASTSNPTFTVTGTIKEVATSFAGSVTVTSGVITVIGPPIITPPPSQATTTIAQGQSETVTVNFSGGSADAGLKFTSITWSVSPIGPTCTISPSTLTLDANGNGSVQVTMNTVGPGSSLAIPQGGDRQTPLFAFLLILPGLGFVFLGAGFSKSKARNHAPWGLLLLLFTVALILSTGACTSIQRSNIPCTSCTTPQAYTVTITARSTSPAFQASGIFTVNVVQ